MMATNKSLQYEDLFNIQIESLNEIHNFKSEFICVICLGIVIKPLQLKCCDHLICSGCLKMYIKNNYKFLKCPLCKKPLTYDTPNKIILRLHSNLLIKCKNFECEKILKYEEYFSHIFNECENLDELIKNKLRYCKKCDEVYETNKIEEETKVQNENGTENSNEGNVCNKILSSAFHECQNSKLVKEYKHEKLHKHRLRYTNIRKNCAYEIYGWMCDFCEGKKDPCDKSYHCSQCRIDMCIGCLNLVKGKKPKTSLHNHELILTAMIEWECDICAIHNKQSFAWSCFACNFDCCIKCFWE